MSFTYPFFLYIGLSGIIIPIIIHLISKIRKKKIYLPELFIFEKELHKIKRVSDLSDIILLLIRIMLIVLLTLFLANPYIKNINKKDNVTTSNDKLYLILIDDTLSTSYSYPTEPLIETLKKEAEKFISETENGANYGIISFNSTISKPFYSKSKQDIINEISFITYDENYEPDINDRITKYINNLEQQPFKEKYLVIFSDFQKSNWDNIKLSINDSNIIAYYFSKDDFTNYSINNASSPEILNYIGQPINIFFNIYSYSNKNNELKIKAVNQNNIISSKLFNIEQNKKSNKKMTIKLYNEGKNNIELKIDYDKYKFDNTTSTQLYTLKSLDVLLLLPDEEKLIKKALLHSIGNEYQRKSNLINIDTEITTGTIYDMIICYNITKISYSKIDFIIDNKKEIPMIIFYSNKDEVFLLEGILDTLYSGNVILENENYQEVTISYPELTSPDKNAFKEMNLDNYDVNFSSTIDININHNNMATYINFSNGNNMLVTYKDNDPIYFISGDISIEQSNIIVSQVLPLLMNKIVYSSIINKFDNEVNMKKVISQNYDYRLKEGELIFLSKSEIELLNNKNSAITIYQDIEELEYLFKKTNNTISKISDNQTKMLRIILLCLILGIILFEIAFSFVRKG